MSARWCPALLVVVTWLAGCATGVQVLPVGTAISAAKPELSRVARQPWWRDDPAYLEVIRRHRLEVLIRQDPGLALRQLHMAVAGSQQAIEIGAVARLTIRYAQELEPSRPGEAANRYLEAAVLAGQHFDAAVGLSPGNPSSSPILGAYNQAVLGLVMSLQKLPGGLRTNHILSVCGKPVLLEAVAGDADSNPGYYNKWLAADGWKQRGLTHHYRRDGLGARLVAVRVNGQTNDFERHQPDEGIFHASNAALRFEPAGGGAGVQPQRVNLVFHNPALTPEIQIDGRNWPLAADFTMPGAMLLARTRPLAKTRWTGLVRPAETPRQHRLYLMQPYSPDRIPVIMVHGLRSTPLTWQELTNELMGDPVLGRRYQLWHYLYPTGLPFLTTAADFREELEATRRLLDPAGHDLATRHMIVMGHSMGGLLARTLVTDSGDALWNSTFAKPLAGLAQDLDQVAELRRMFYFQPKPYIKRAIYLAVPHHGASLAAGLLGRFASGRVVLPAALHQFIASLDKTIPGLLRPDAAPLFKKGYPDSIRVLSPKTPGLVALAALPPAPGIPFHSIMGDRGLGGGAHRSDGFVTYGSSHLDGATSELVVPSGHRVQQNPAAIAEVKRILTLHLAEQSAVAAGILPAVEPVPHVGLPGGLRVAE